jgi:hypothetical protein
VKPKEDAAQLEANKSVGQSKLESFGDDEIGVLPDASANEEGSVQLPLKSGVDVRAAEPVIVKSRNLRQKLKRQPEVFDEE